MRGTVDASADRWSWPNAERLAAGDPRATAVASIEEPVRGADVNRLDGQAHALLVTKGQLGLEQLLDAFREAAAVGPGAGPLYVLFDEIQHLREWEVHLKSGR